MDIEFQKDETSFFSSQNEFRKRMMKQSGIAFDNYFPMDQQCLRVALLEKQNDLRGNYIQYCSSQNILWIAFSDINKFHPGMNNKFVINQNLKIQQSQLNYYQTKKEDEQKYGVFIANPIKMIITQQNIRDISFVRLGMNRSSISTPGLTQKNYIISKVKCGLWYMLYK